MSDDKDKRKLRSDEGNKFFKLDDRGNPVEVEQEEETTTEQVDDFPDFSNITDPEELAEAYKELAKKYFEIINQDRASNLNQSRDNSKLIKVQEEDIKVLEKELKILKEQLENAKALINNANPELQLDMDLQAKDVIMGIPVFSGEQKQLDAFLNTCGVYYDMAKDAQKPDILKIIKAKIVGEALSKAGPLNDDLNTWALLKKRLKERIKRPISFEYANEDLNNTIQKKDESIEDYGARMKTKLKRLNDATRPIAANDAEKEVLRKANEKHAISKFEQNIRNQTVRVLVSAAGKTTLDECIAYAMQKELTEKNKIVKCNICGMSNHDESSCRRKSGNQNNNKKNFGQKFEKKGTGNSNWRRQYNDNSQSNDQGDSHEKSEKSYNEDGKRSFNKFSQSKNQTDWKNRNKNDESERNQKSVKTAQQEENNDEISIEDAIRLAEESKN